jgi:D-glycero-D-manno-heptose 1,7-bisphosphate phosphatase
MRPSLVVRGCPGTVLPEPYGGEPRPVAFLDRDGVLNVDRGYVATRERFEWTPTGIEAVRWLASLDYVVAVVTNQSGIGRGLYREEDFLELTEWFLGEAPEVRVVAYCPHRPEDLCPGRKPGTGQLEAVASVYPCLKEGSFLVGDKDSDVLAAKNFGIMAVRTGDHGPLDAIRMAVRSLTGKGTA